MRGRGAGQGRAPAHATSAVRARPGRPSGGMTATSRRFLSPQPAQPRAAPRGGDERRLLPAGQEWRSSVTGASRGDRPGHRVCLAGARAAADQSFQTPHHRPSNTGEKWRHPQINRGRESFAAGPVLAKAQGSPSSGRKRRRRGTGSRGRARGAPRSTGGRPHAERAVTGPRLADATLHSLRDVLHLSGYADVIICDFENVKCGDRRQSHRKRAEKMHET